MFLPVIPHSLEVGLVLAGGIILTSRRILSVSHSPTRTYFSVELLLQLPGATTLISLSTLHLFFCFFVFLFFVFFFFIFSKRPIESLYLPGGLEPWAGSTHPMKGVPVCPGLL
jgi:hypothetical protein